MQTDISDNQKKDSVKQPFDGQWYLVGPFKRHRPYSDENETFVPIDKLPTPQKKVNIRKINLIEGVLELGTAMPGNETYIFKEVRVPDDQKLAIGVFADWWMQMWINGKQVHSTMQYGNGNNKRNVTNHIVEIPLKTGSNVLCVRVISGKELFRFGIAAKDQLPEYIQKIANRPTLPENQDTVCLKVAPFVIDITPPEGFPIAYGVNKDVDTPIFIRGVIIDDTKKRVIVAAMDVISIARGDIEMWRMQIADAGNTCPECVFLHALHLHDSVRLSTAYNQACKKFLNTEPTPEWYMKQSLDSFSSCIKKLCSNTDSWYTVKKLSTAENRVWGLASNRRILDDDGKVGRMRFSRASDYLSHNAPVGCIDPLLRTIAFVTQEGPIVALHYYASHPMGMYGVNKVSTDVPGVALEYLRAKMGDKAYHVYFTGCGGNVAFGKYWYDPDTAQSDLGNRLGESMYENIEHLHERKIGPLSTATASFEMPLKPGMEIDKLTKDLTTAAEPSEWDAWYYSVVKAQKQWNKCEIHRFSIGNDVHMLSMIHETCVEYQLFAQQLVPERFLACAAYGGGEYGYIPTVKMFDENGYEDTIGTITTPMVEKRYRKAIEELLLPLQ